MFVFYGFPHLRVYNMGSTSALYILNVEVGYKIVILQKTIYQM